MSALQRPWLVSQLLNVAHSFACVVIKGTTDGTIVLGGIPIAGILIHCVIKVYNVTEKKIDDFQQRTIMLNHATYFEPFVKKKKIYLNCSLRTVFYKPCNY